MPPSAAPPSQKVGSLPFGNLPGLWAFTAAFVLQRAACLTREHPQACGGETPCEKEEMNAPGCPKGRICSRSPPAPCPPGTFLSEVGPHNIPFCYPCPSEFFNAWHGQNACFPCGSEATQPEEGKDTCVCRRHGRVFQPSDGQCPCLPGHKDAGEPVGCVQREYKICQDGAAWNQEGQCLTKTQWNDHCAHEVCATPEEARGYDPGLGICLCWRQHPSGMHDPLFREGQRHVLKLSCPGGIPQISVAEDSASQNFYLLDRPSSPRSVGHPCNSDHGQKSVPLYVIKVDGKPREEHQTFPWSASLNSTHAGEPMPGIPSPVVCLQTNDTLAFLVTPEHYPEYDSDHFYNTLQQFDWGRFRALAEKSRLEEQSPLLFLQQFQLPGVYVFRLSSNHHRKMYLRTLPPGGRCFGDGPFAFATPRSLIQTGIAKFARPLKGPHWPGVLWEMVLLLGLCLVLLVQCHSLSWARKATLHAIFRTHQQGYNLDVYMSPRARMISVRRGQSRQDSLGLEGNHSGSLEVEDQVDLEWFDTEAFFGILHQQSLTVTAKLSQTKEELKLLYLKLLGEVRSLRQLRGAQPCIPASRDQLLGSTQKEQQEAAEAAARAAEEEARRRRCLAAGYASHLRHQLELLHQDLQARQDQWASFCSALMEAQRLLKAPASCGPGKQPQADQSTRGMTPQLDTVLGHLSQIMLQEGHRLKAWGFLGTGTGAELLQPGPQEGADNISVDPITKLMVPGPNCAMLPASGHGGPIPSGYFIHPDTGRVLPEAGHLGYDLLSATLVPTSDSNAGGVRTSAAAILPYVPYPTCPATARPPATRLPILQPRRTSQLGAVMTDPITGIEVPVLAVTLHPKTRQWLTLGGTYCNPLTGTLAPLELGGPMEDPVTGDILPILGIGLDEHTGQVLALGGLRDATGTLLLPGDSFVEPLSGKTARLQGACQQAGQTLPHMGGPQTLLDANVLVAQRQVLIKLQRHQESPGCRTQGPLEAAIKDMKKALALSLYHLLQQARRLARQLEAACDIEANGGCIGMMRYPGTELWVPILYGMEIPDPEGSGLMVPILGIWQDGDSGNNTPLAGSVEDADGKGLVPVSIGAQAIDPLTGERGPVIGAQMDPSARVVVPVVQVLEALPRGAAHPCLELLEQELRARQQHWQLQEHEQQQLAEHLWHLGQELRFIPGHTARLQLRTSEEACAALEIRCLQEMERRARALSSLSSPERGLLSQADKEEWDAEVQVALGIRKVLQSLMQATEKLRKTSGRLHGQEEEVCLQQSKNQNLWDWKRPRKIIQHLSDELQKVVRKRQNFLDWALGQMQYQRELSRLQLLHSQMIVSGSPVCLENYPGDIFYGAITTPRHQAATCSLLIPVLKNLTAALTEDQSRGPGLQEPRPEADADKADILHTSPLFSILKKMDIKSRVHKEVAELQEQLCHRPDLKNVLWNLLKPHTIQKEELVTVPPTDLSAWEFVVYQYGLSVLHLLIRQLQAPEITLQIASPLPAVEVSGSAFHGSFFYQSAGSTLFVGRECLASVGGFVLLLTYCLAHIKAGDLHQDSKPSFLESFYEGLKACLREAFSTTLRMAAVSQDSKCDTSLSALLLEGQPASERERDLLSRLTEHRHEARLATESSEEYIKKNRDLLLFTNMEHYLKNILSAEQRSLGMQEMGSVAKRRSRKEKW